MPIYSIYKITNKINGKTYIGFDSQWPKRINDHIKLASKPNPKQYIHKAIKKYGLANFHFEVIYQSKDGQHTLNIMENHFINEYHSFIGYHDSKGYNMTIGGQGSLGHEYHPTPESNAKRSTALKNRTMTEEHKTKIGQSRKGLKFSKEWRENISKARINSQNKPTILSDDHKMKIGQSNSKPKTKACCLACHKVVSVNALNGNHKC